jgi:hypothetical protein
MAAPAVTSHHMDHLSKIMATDISLGLTLCIFWLSKQGHTLLHSSGDAGCSQKVPKCVWCGCSAFTLLASAEPVDCSIHELCFCESLHVHCLLCTQFFFFMHCVHGLLNSSELERWEAGLNLREHCSVHTVCGTAGISTRQQKGGEIFFFFFLVFHCLHAASAHPSSCSAPHLSVCVCMCVCVCLCVCVCAFGHVPPPAGCVG